MTDNKTTIPTIPGRYLDRLGNTWRLWNDLVFMMPGDPMADPAGYGPWERLIPESEVQGDPSDAQADAVAQAIIDHDEDRLTCYDHDGYCCPCGELHDSTYRDWERHRARAALRAAGGVR